MIDRTANGPYMMKRYVYVYYVISRISSIVAICRILFPFFLSKFIRSLFDFV